MDNDWTPGQFLLSGSTRFLTVPTFSESLAGRAGFIDIWPLSMAERNVTPTEQVTSGRFEYVTAARLEAPPIEIEVPSAPELDVPTRFWNFGPRFDGTLEVPLVDAGSASPEDLADGRVDGALAVVDLHDDLDPTEQAEAAGAAGAKAVLNGGEGVRPALSGGSCLPLPGDLAWKRPPGRRRRRPGGSPCGPASTPTDSGRRSTSSSAGEPCPATPLVVPGSSPDIPGMLEVAEPSADGSVPMANGRSAVQTVAMVVSVIFLLIGVLGFIPGITSDFDRMSFAGHESEAMLLGIFQVSILHNIVHLLFGVVGLALARSAGGARSFLIGGGGVYALLWLYGLVVADESAANFVPLNTADDWLHLVLAVGMIALGVLLGPRPARGRTEPGT